MFHEVVGGRKPLLAQKSEIRVRIFFSHQELLHEPKDPLLH